MVASIVYNKTNSHMIFITSTIIWMTNIFQCVFLAENPTCGNDDRTGWASGIHSSSSTKAPGLQRPLIPEAILTDPTIMP